MDNLKFEILLAEYKNVVERFVYYKLPTKEDADDVLQEVYLTAFHKFNTLKNEATFKSWLIRIAQNKCNDFYRIRAKQMEIPLDEAIASTLTDGRFGITETNIVRDTIEILADKDKQILYLYYFKNKPQAEIAKVLGIPIGTVKSRLHIAKQNFKKKYPCPPKSKGDSIMKRLPEYLPSYTIVKSDKDPFAVKWEELMGWFLVPKMGEKLSWGMYDISSRQCSHIYDMEVTGKAQVHGIEGVELIARETDYAQKKEVSNRTFVVQLTDSHCRYLAVTRTDHGIKKYITFLDEDAFMPNWGFGEDNCGNEINIYPKGDITRNGNIIKSIDKPFLLDIVGRYTVNINGKDYNTVCVMSIEEHNPDIVIEQYLDKSGRTILWRRFNRNDWAFIRYKQKWSEKLPNNEQLIVNDEIYVHWYDCITDYIL